MGVWIIVLSTGGVMQHVNIYQCKSVAFIHQTSSGNSRDLLHASQVSFTHSSSISDLWMELRRHAFETFRLNYDYANCVWPQTEQRNRMEENPKESVGMQVVDGTGHAPCTFSVKIFWPGSSVGSHDNSFLNDFYYRRRPLTTVYERWCYFTGCWHHRINGRLPPRRPRIGFWSAFLTFVSFASLSRRLCFWGACRNRRTNKSKSGCPLPSDHSGYRNNIFGRRFAVGSVDKA